MENIKSFLDSCVIDDKNIYTYNEEIINEINNMLNGNFEPSYNNGVLNYYAGLIKYFNYNNDEQDEEESIIYFTKAIEYGNTDAMVRLGYYYHCNENFDDAIKYHLMGIENGNFEMVDDLCTIYTGLHDYENVKKYYIMALENGNLQILHKLGMLYELNFNDTENAKKYYEMSVEHNNILGMLYLGEIYLKLNDLEKGLKYCLMAAEHGCVNALEEMSSYMTNIKLYELLTNNHNNNKLILDVIEKIENIKEVKIYRIQNNLVKLNYGICTNCLDDNIKLAVLKNDKVCINCYEYNNTIYSLLWGDPPDWEW